VSKRGALLVVGFVWILGGCSDDSSGPSNQDAGDASGETDSGTVDSGATDAGPDATTADAQPDADASFSCDDVTDVCCTEGAPAADTALCNGAAIGSTVANHAFGGRCNPSPTEPRGSCMSADALCYVVEATDATGLCYQTCDSPAPAFTSTGGCPSGSRCFDTIVEGTGVCVPDCQMHSDCVAQKCDDNGSCIGAEPSPIAEGGDPSCDTLCAAVTASCTGGNKQYADEAACLAFCNDVAGWPIGTAEDINVNTVGCRLVAAEIAGSGDAAVQCPIAGPSGGDGCGTYCDNYCDLTAATCTGDNALYASRDDCMAACDLFSQDGEPGESSGDTVQCRIYHAGIAGSGETPAPATHCPHASFHGAGVCGGVCDWYCNLTLANCTGGNVIFTNKEACMMACGGLATTGTDGDTSGNTVQCRIHYADLAAADAATNCPEAHSMFSTACVD